MDARTEGPPVVVVTGGGAGIGAAIAEELGRHGSFVVTVDPLVSLDGSAALPAPEETTAGRIVAGGGTARASSVSVTDAEAVSDLFGELAATHGHLDAVINVAGISRPTGFAKGSDSDWRDVLSVHLGGYLNVLAAALPIMGAAGHGRILGVTSGSGWRAADAGAYSCAKRAVAALTWQLGRQAPPGVAINALSPIAVTRMVTAALGARAARPSASRPDGKATGGLSLGAMPEPEELGPLAAWLVGDEAGWCRGQILFAGGPEVAVLDPPRLLEVVRTDGAADLASLLEATVPGALAPAEAAQAAGGGSNPRFAAAYRAAGDAAAPAPADTTCAVVSDRPSLAATVRAALLARGVRATVTRPDEAAAGIPRGTDALVVALAGDGGGTGTEPWERIVAEHGALVEGIQADARWTRSAAAHAAATGRPLRLVTLTDATTTAGRSRAQASAQLARAGLGATDDRVEAFAVALEAGTAAEEGVAGELAAHLVTAGGSAALAGAELAVGEGWFGLRSHPRAGVSFSLGLAEVPSWFGAALHEALGIEGSRR